VITPVTAPAAPEGATIIGLAYDFGPEGATFDPPITVTFSYSLSDIPEGVNENSLTISYYDTSQGAWVTLEDINVNTSTHTVSGKLSHFTTFAVLAMPGATPTPTTPAPTAPAATTPAPTTPAPTTPA
jgi:hypothetical protein